MKVIFQKAAGLLLTACLSLSLLPFTAHAGQATPEQMQKIVESTASVQVTCLPVKHASPCTSRTYKDTTIIEIFQQAIVRSTDLEGQLNYMAEYEITVRKKDRSEEKYMLALGTEKGKSALIVSNKNGQSHGYETTVEYADILRNFFAPKSELTFTNDQLVVKHGSTPLSLQYEGSTWTTIWSDGNEGIMAGIGPDPQTVNAAMKKDALKLRKSSVLSIHTAGKPTKVTLSLKKGRNYVERKITKGQYKLPAQPGYYIYSLSAQWDKDHSVNYEFSVYVK